MTDILESIRRIFVPIRKDTKYRKAATATLAVLDRTGRRLGTVYLVICRKPAKGGCPNNCFT